MSRFFSFLYCFIVSVYYSCALFFLSTRFHLTKVYFLVLYGSSSMSKATDISQKKHKQQTKKGALRHEYKQHVRFAASSGGTGLRMRHGNHSIGFTDFIQTHPRLHATVFAEKICETVQVLLAKDSAATRQNKIVAGSERELFAKTCVRIRLSLSDARNVF